MPTPATALVTGANRGLGLELARQLLERGDRVVATCRQPDAAPALDALALAHPGRVHAARLDVADPAAHAALVDALPHWLGADGRLDLLINNAGVLPAGEQFGTLQLDTLMHSLRINAAGALLLTQALAPLLADGARVLNMSSRLGAIGLTTRFGTPSYAISKAALNMATAQLAHALAPRGIVVVAASPGWVRTDMGGAQADLAPETAVAGLLAQLATLGPHDSGRFFGIDGAPIAW